MGDDHDVSYDANTTALLEKIHGVIEHYQSLFEAGVNQEPFGLLRMAETLAHLPDPRLRAFPEHATRWKAALEQHMNVLAELSKIHQQGIQGIQETDRRVGQGLHQTTGEN